MNDVQIQKEIYENGNLKRTICLKDGLNRTTISPVSYILCHNNLMI